MNDLLRHKLTPRASNQKWVTISVEDAERLLDLLEWAERLPKFAERIRVPARVDLGRKESLATLDKGLIWGKR
jgi:hypothetical protein